MKRGETDTRSNIWTSISSCCNR